jgi:hypothetical protein
MYDTPLLNPAWVPWQVIVRHEVRNLKVHALTSGIGCNQYPHGGIDPESVLDRAAVLALHATVDRDDRLRSTQLVADPFGHVVERVLMF